jgi:hypothetical protein
MRDHQVQFLVRLSPQSQQLAAAVVADLLLILLGKAVDLVAALGLRRPLFQAVQAQLHRVIKEATA